MRISVVADVHGNYEALARIAEQADRLIVLGDLLDYVDYHDPSAGILGEVFGTDAARHFARLRAGGHFAELRRFNLALWGTVADAAALLSSLVRERYRKVVSMVGPDTVVILGNVDVPAEWTAVAGNELPCRDAEVVEIGGLRFGFVGGGVSRRASPGPGAADSAGAEGSAWRPFLRAPHDFRGAVGALGPVDVLCSHIPPDITALRYDAVPGRLEMAGPGLLDHIDTRHPAVAMFGHVHQPLAPRARRGMTECINVGHFQRAERAFVLETDLVRRAVRGGGVAGPATGG